MLDSVSGGMLPIAALAALIGGVTGYVTRRWIAAAVPAITAVVIAYLWFWLPIWVGMEQLTEPSAGWDLVATIVWSTAAVPASLLAFLLARYIRQRRARAV